MSTTSEELRQLWQRQALDAPRINLTYLRHRLQALQRRTRLRNVFEYVSGITCAVWAAWFTWPVFRSRPLMVLSMVLWMAGMVVVMVRWHRCTRVPDAGGELGTLDALQFYRRQLERQRDARRGNLRWWLIPIAPCLIVMLVALYLEKHPTPWIGMGAMVVWVVCGMTAGLMAYERSARRIQQEIDALDSMASKT